MAIVRMTIVRVATLICFYRKLPKVLWGFHNTKEQIKNKFWLFAVKQWFNNGEKLDLKIDFTEL
jgi:hypothetical protein